MTIDSFVDGQNAISSFLGGLCLWREPPKNGEITLLLTTNSLMCSKYVSQKRNEAIDNGQRYNMLLKFILFTESTEYIYFSLI